MIRFSCPACGLRLVVQDSGGNAVFECRCGQYVIAPAQTGEPGRLVREDTEGVGARQGVRFLRSLGAVLGASLGLRPGEVEELLGPPDDRRGASFTYTVDLGYRWGSTPWTYALDVAFGGDEPRVVKASLHD